MKPDNEAVIKEKTGNQGELPSTQQQVGLWIPSFMAQAI